MEKSEDYYVGGTWESLFDKVNHTKGLLMCLLALLKDRSVYDNKWSVTNLLPEKEVLLLTSLIPNILNQYTKNLSKESSPKTGTSGLFFSWWH
jgi:hypothetical protein